MRRGSKPRTKLKIFLLLLALAAAAVVALAAFGLGPDPEVQVRSALPGIGPETEVQVHATEPRRGLDEVRVVLQQGDREEVLAEETFSPRPIWKLWTDEHSPEATLAVAVGKRHQPWLVDGEATLRVVATHPGGWLRTPDPTVVTTELPVKVSPPGLSVISNHTYVSQGGTEAVVYRIQGEVVRHGVATPEIFFPGFPVPGRDGEYFAFFSVPWDRPTPRKLNRSTEKPWLTKV